MSPLRSAVARPTLYYPVILRATSASARTFSQSATRQGGAAKLKLDPPTGWLWGKDPKDKKSKKWESWEPVWYFGYFGSMAVAAIAYMYKPDTSIQTWALEEARRRLEAEGILSDPDNEKK